MNATLEEQFKNLNRLAEADFEASNKSIIDFSKTNITISTIVTAFIGLSFKDSTDIYEKRLGFIVVTFFLISVLFGAIQSYIDFKHARSWGKFRQDLANDIAIKKIKSYENYLIVFYERSASLKNSSGNIFVYGQFLFSFIGLVLLFILIMDIIF